MNEWSTFDHMVLLFMKCFVKKKLSMPRLHTATTESRVFFPQNLQKKTSQLSLSTGRFAAETAADFGWNTKSQGTVVMIGYGDQRFRKILDESTPKPYKQFKFCVPWCALGSGQGKFLIIPLLCPMNGCFQCLYRLFHPRKEPHREHLPPVVDNTLHRPL